MKNILPVKMLEYQVCNIDLAFVTDSSGMLPAVLSFSMDKIEDNTTHWDLLSDTGLPDILESYMKLVYIQL